MFHFSVLPFSVAVKRPWVLALTLLGCPACATDIVPLNARMVVLVGVLPAADSDASVSAATAPHRASSSDLFIGGFLSVGTGPPGRFGSRPTLVIPATYAFKTKSLQLVALVAQGRDRGRDRARSGQPGQLPDRDQVAALQVRDHRVELRVEGEGRRAQLRVRGLGRLRRVDPVELVGRGGQHLLLLADADGRCPRGEG